MIARAAGPIRVGIVLAGVASLVVAAIPVARHMSGVVILDRAALPAVPLVRSAPATQTDASVLLDVALFGKPPQQVAAEPSGEDMPDLALTGIIASSGAAAAALLDVDGVTGLYRREQPVAGGLVLTDIFARTVSLTDGERTVVLRFDAIETTGPQDTTGAVAAVKSDLHQRFKSGLVVPARYEAPGQPVTTADYIDHWRRRIRKNPQAVLDAIGLKPTERGYVIADKHDIGVRLAGLKRGDLVRSVNGQPVGDPDADRLFYDDIAASGLARLEVERGGEVFSLSFPLR